MPVSLPDAAQPSSFGSMPIVWRLTLLMALSLIVLTAADIGTTILALRGHGSELNVHATDGQGGLNIPFLVAVNFAVLTPMVLGYFLAMRMAHRVPAPVLDHWWRHIFDIFTVSPRSAAGRRRLPLRLATAAMIIVVLKVLIVASNVLVVLRMPNPTSFVVGLFSNAGLSNSSLWHAAYAVLIVPCYAAAVGLAALTLSAVQREHAAADTGTDA